MINCCRLFCDPRRDINGRHSTLLSQPWGDILSRITRLRSQHFDIVLLHVKSIDFDYAYDYFKVHYVTRVQTLPELHRDEMNYTL